MIDTNFTLFFRGSFSIFPEKNLSISHRHEACALQSYVSCKIRNTLPLWRAVKVEVAPVGIEGAPKEERGCLVDEGYRREDDERPVRLSFKLFADETRITRRFARRREALTGKQRVGRVWSVDTASEVNVGSNGHREGPAERRAATKDNTEFMVLFTRIPPGVRFLVASFHPGFAFLVRSSWSIRMIWFSREQCSFGC